MAESSGNAEREGKAIRVGIVTVSDSCSSGQTDDRSGTNLKHLIEGKKLIHGEVCVKEIVPDEQERIKAVLTEWTDKLKLDLILSTGGTGFTARDVTPEATKSVLDRDAIGITVAMLSGSLSITPLAMLSRLTCGIRKSTLIINLPGSTKGAEECFRFAAVGVSHAVDQLRGSKGSVKRTHSQLQGEGIHRDQPGQLQNVSDESLDTSIENLDPPSEIPDPVIDTDFPATVTFDSLDSNPIPRTTPILQDNNSVTPLATDTNCQGRVPLPERASSLDKGDNSNSEDFSHLCFQAESNSNLPEEPLTIMALVANQNNAVTQTTTYDKQDKDISELFPFQGNFSDSNQQVLACKSTGVRRVTTPEIPSQVVQEILTLPVLNTCTETTENKTTKHTTSVRRKYSSVYEFEEEGEREAQNKSKSENRQSYHIGNNEKILRAKLHKSADEGEVTHVEVGPEIKKFLRTHPAIRGIYLNKGKRDVKRHLVVMRRESKAVDVGSWHRGRHIHDRNRLDDYFDLTDDGIEKKKKVENRYARDEYVVNWYMWCPGHGNCRRKCGGYGKCISGCKGKTHKQDRHNCSLLVNLKMFLSNTSKWRVHISGSHVPLESSILWEPPDNDEQRISEDTRDVIIASATTKMTTSSQIQEALSKRPLTSELLEVPSKRKICRFVSSMKKRRRQKNYKCRDAVTDIQEMSTDGEPSETDVVKTVQGRDSDTGTEKEKLELEEEEEDVAVEDTEQEEVDEDEEAQQEEKRTDRPSESDVSQIKVLHTVSDSVHLDEANILPTATVIKFIDAAGNFYYYTRSVAVGDNRTGSVVTSQSDSDSASVTQTDLVLLSSSVGRSAGTGFVYTPSSDGVERTGHDHGSSDHDGGCGDLGALILAAYQQQ